jgi:multimeric flavodoxin WrbA
MKFSILMGSYRLEGNTATLLRPFIVELESLGAQVDYIPTAPRRIEPCTACWQCQNRFDGPGCSKDDDMGAIFDSVLSCDCIVFASPVYSWYCTPSLKAVMDRLVYSMNKYYGDVAGPCLWEGRSLALVTTCGYDLEHGAGVLEEGLRRYAVHSRLTYLGKLAVRDIDGIQFFTNEAVVSAARDFARVVFQAVAGKLSGG